MFHRPRSVSYEFTVRFLIVTVTSWRWGCYGVRCTIPRSSRLEESALSSGLLVEVRVCRAC